MTAGALAAALVAAVLVLVRVAVRAGVDRGAAPPAAPLRHPAPAWFVSRLSDLDLGVAPDGLWWAWVAAATAAPATALVLAGPALAVLVFAAAVVAPLFGWRTQRGRRDARTEAGLPGALEAVARSLRSGAALRGAVTEAGVATPAPLGADLTRVARTAELSGIVAALETWGHDRPLPGVRLAVAALCLGAETGGAQARAIDGVAVTLRQRLAAAAEARALASQARASAAVIALAPIAFCALASATDPRVADFLFRSPAGAAVLAVGLLLDGAGAAWMGRLTRLTA
jgi:tight adherence protein B